MPISIPPFTPTALQPNSAETFATYVKGQPAAKIPLTGSELFPILQNGFIVQAPAASLIGTITVGGSTIFGSTDKTILFDKAGVIGEDTNLEWDYTNHILKFGPNGHLNSIGTTWQFDVGGTNQLDFGISNASCWTMPGNSNGLVANFFQGLGPSGTQPNVDIALTTDSHVRLVFGVTAADQPFLAFGTGAAAVDTSLSRQGAAGIFGIQNRTIASPASLWVYKISDAQDTAPIANYERGVFDWTTTANVLTIGTQKGGSGTARDMYLSPASGNVLQLINASIGATLVVGGTNAVGVSANTTQILAGGTGSSAGSIISALNTSGANMTAQVGVQCVAANNAPVGFDMTAGAVISWNSNSSNFAGSWDTQIERDAAGIIAVYGTTPGAVPTGIRAYNLFSGVGNYERGVFDWTVTANVLTIGAQNAGGGSTLRAVQLVGASITAQNASLSVAADTGGIASTNTISSANSTTIGAGTGTVKMSSANNANNTGWLKCYIGTQVAWIPCWTTNAP